MVGGGHDNWTEGFGICGFSARLVHFFGSDGNKL